MVVLVTCKNKEEPIQNESRHKVFPIIIQWELSVAMETRVLIRSGPKPNAINPLPQWCSKCNLILIGQLVSEMFMFESVNGRTDRPRHESHTISSPRAFGSVELKNGYTWCSSVNKWKHIRSYKQFGHFAVELVIQIYGYGDAHDALNAGGFVFDQISILYAATNLN